MQTMYYIGVDVHKRTISYCVKDVSGRVYAEGSLTATRFDLDRWMKTLPQPWTAAMEATVFTGWIYDQLQPHAAALKVAHPLMLRAIAAAKKKNDRIDAKKICDCLRCDFLPECYMASTAIRERRRTLRYRNLLVRQMVQMKNKISMLLMEAGVSYNKQKLHKAGYFRDLLAEIRQADWERGDLATDAPVKISFAWPGPLENYCPQQLRIDKNHLPVRERHLTPSFSRKMVDGGARRPLRFSANRNEQNASVLQNLPSYLRIKSRLTLAVIGNWLSRATQRIRNCLF
jgi:hypothetical protein